MARQSPEFYSAWRKRNPNHAGYSDDQIDAVISENPQVYREWWSRRGQPSYKGQGESRIDTPGVIEPSQSGAVPHPPLTPKEVGPVATPEELAKTASSGGNPGVDLTAMFGEIVEAAGGAAEALDELAKEAASVLGETRGVPESAEKLTYGKEGTRLPEAHPYTPTPASNGPVPAQGTPRRAPPTMVGQPAAGYPPQAPVPPPPLPPPPPPPPPGEAPPTPPPSSSGAATGAAMFGGAPVPMPVHAAPAGGAGGGMGDLIFKAFMGGGVQGAMGQGPGGLGATAALGEMTMKAVGADPLSFALIQGAKMAKAGFVDAPMAAGNAAVGMANTQELGKMGSTAFGGVADTVGNMANATLDPFSQAVLRTVQGVALLGKTAFDALEGVRNWTTGLHRANTEFAEFSAGMAQVKAQQEVRQIALDRERGERRAATARELAESRDRLNRAIAPIEDAWGNLMNQLGTTINNHLTPVIDQLANLLNVKDEGAGNAVTTDNLGEQMISEASRRGWIEDYGLGDRGRRLQQGMGRELNR